MPILARKIYFLIQKSLVASMNASVRVKYIFHWYLLVKNTTSLSLLGGGGWGSAGGVISLYEELSYILFFLSFLILFSLFFWGYILTLHLSIILDMKTFHSLFFSHFHYTTLHTFFFFFFQFSDEPLNSTQTHLLIFISFFSLYLISPEFFVFFFFF